MRLWGPKLLSLLVSGAIWQIPLLVAWKEQVFQGGAEEAFSTANQFFAPPLFFQR